MPQTLQRLKDNIQTDIRVLEPEALMAVMENALERTYLHKAANE